jgi:hypothetical protein
MYNAGFQNADPHELSNSYVVTPSSLPHITTNPASWIYPYESCGAPYATCGFGSPGAMKLVSGFFASFAAEHRAMVGELFESGC